MVRRVDMLTERGSVKHQVVGRTVQASQPAKDLPEGVGR
jgi:hypothetical protein